MKPLGHKAYGSIPHLPNSRLGPGEHCIPKQQANICLEKTRSKHEVVFVQEKLDGSNVAIAKINDEIIPLVRSGYRAESSKFKQHILFAGWVHDNQSRFNGLLKNGERLCGEWLAQAHGTRYQFTHEPFVAFDIMREDIRIGLDEFYDRVQSFDFVRPRIIHIGGACPLEKALKKLDEEESYHHPLERIEGLIYRVEKNDLMLFIAKYVRPDKVDGKYFSEDSELWNWFDTGMYYRQKERMKGLVV